MPEPTTPAPIATEAHALLDAAHSLGYLDETERAAIHRGAIAPQTPRGAGVVASWLYAHGWLDAQRLVAVCDAIAQPLLGCDGCRTAWWCCSPASAAPIPCPTCDGPTRSLSGAQDAPAPTATPNVLPLRVHVLGETPRFSMSVRLALRYQLITPQVALDHGRHKDSTELALALQMFVDGRLTRGALRFLERRIEDVAAGGLSPVRTPTRPLADLCRREGYLGRDPAARFGKLGLAEDDPPGPAREQRELGAVQLLYNLGELQYYEAIDLLERRGIDLDRCLSCRLHWRVTADLPRGPCPACGRPLIRLAGRCDELELGVAPQAERHWAIRAADGAGSVRVRRADDESTDRGARSPGAFPGAALAFEVATATLPGAHAITDDDVRSLVLRLRLLDRDDLAEASRVARESDALLLRVLAGLGFVPGAAVSYLRRRLGIDPVPPRDGASLIELACRAGYLPGTMRSLEDAGPLAEIQALRVLEAAFNGGRLGLWQLIDLLERGAIHLVHCPTCSHELLLAESVPPSVADKCLMCGAATIALNDPAQPTRGHDAWGTVLPDLRSLRIRTEDECLTRLAASNEGGPEEAPPTTAPDQHIVALIHRYRFVSENRLAEDLRDLERAGGELDLEDWLFQEGRIDATMLTFLASHRDPRNLLGTTGTPGHRLVQAAITRGALSLAQFHTLYRGSENPDADSLDPLDLALDLYRRASFAPYQVIDLLEAVGSVLVHCPACVCQISPSGELAPADDYACPLCGTRLLWLTPNPRRPRQVDRVPPDLALYVLRLEGASLRGTVAVAPPSRLGRVADTTPPLIELELAPASPAAKAPGAPTSPGHNAPTTTLAPPQEDSASKPAPSPPTADPFEEPASSVRLRERKARAIAVALAARRPKTQRPATMGASAPLIELRQPDARLAPSEPHGGVATRHARILRAGLAVIIALVSGAVGFAIQPLLAPRPTAAIDPNAEMGPAPPWRLVADEEIMAWGLVVPPEPGAISAQHCLWLRLDLDQDLWVHCTTSQSVAACVRVSELVIQEPDRVFIKVVGHVRRGPRGEIFLEATELYRAYPPLPKSRWVRR